MPQIQRETPYPHWEFRDPVSGDLLRVLPERGGLISGWRCAGHEVVYLDLERFLDPAQSGRGGFPVSSRSPEACRTTGCPCLRGSLPHAWLFPRMAAVVHHGGAGTTGAGLASGRPSIVTPVMGDQPFWGKRVHALGVGPPPIPRRHLSVDSLADAIESTVGNDTMREKAADLGERIRAEDGTTRAVAIIERAFAQR